MLYRSGPYLTAHHDPGLARAFNPQGAQQSLVYALTSAGAPVRAPGSHLRHSVT